jgi:hypothetical protein
MLEEKVPPEFQHRDLDDLGCGDGKITLMLKEIFQPRRLRGYDISPSLVRRARKKGIDVEVKDLDAGIPNGELAVMWGVLHHLKDREVCLQRIRDNYRMAFIREPIKNNIRVDWEMGQPLAIEEIERLIKLYFNHATSLYCGNCVLIFYRKPE